MFTHQAPPPRRIKTTATPTTMAKDEPVAGILLGDSCYWHPDQVANPHGCIIGGSGAGKTQTLKAIAHASRTDLAVQIVVIDFHGDQAIEGETCHPIHMESPHGINPLVINLDRQGGGPNLKAIELAMLLRKTLTMGPNQEGLLIEVIKDCYSERRIFQEKPMSWLLEPPNFADLKFKLDTRVEDKEAVKLRLKMSAMFEYGIFCKPQPPLGHHTRWDLSKLPPELQAIAGDALASQVMNAHRLLGDTTGLRTLLFIDEAKELGHSRALDRIAADGRKYGLGLWVASQSSRHISKDVLSNTFTKLVLPVDASELPLTARTFRFSQEAIAALNPLESLVRFGKAASKISITPYYQRCG
ncbi:DUF87 domain-containing protein [Synechocystis sp. LKSZ1]|uniref:ATP-binding protein n=1 Tax=Synechocystis sp. LKSZ1 TaxID=3144951 RepID=UPI00336BD576